MLSSWSWAGVVLLTGSRPELVLRFSTAEEHTLAQTLVPALLFAFLPRGLDRSLLLEFARYAAGACGIFLCIMPAGLKTIEHLLSTKDLTLCLLKL
jgi:hypothetical protein